jgi:hypothetical protein
MLLQRFPRSAYGSKLHLWIKILDISSGELGVKVTWKEADNHSPVHIAVAVGSSDKNKNSYEHNIKPIYDPVGLMYISQTRTTHTGPFLPSDVRESPSVMIRATLGSPEKQVKSTEVGRCTALNERNIHNPQVCVCTRKQTQSILDFEGCDVTNLDA